MSNKQEKKGRESKFYNEYPCRAIRKRITEELHWSLTEAAEKMKAAGIENVTPEAVRQWTGGYSRPDMNKLKDIANVLSCSINYLFGIDALPEMDKSEINRITGLSDSAIDILKQLKNGDDDFNRQSDIQDALSTVNRIIENERLIRAIDAYLAFDPKSISQTDFKYLPETLECAMLLSVQSVLRDAKYNCEYTD